MHVTVQKIESENVCLQKKLSTLFKNRKETTGKWKKLLKLTALYSEVKRWLIQMFVCSNKSSVFLQSIQKRSGCGRYTQSMSRLCMFISTQICQDSMLLHASFKMQCTNSELWQHFRQHFFRIDSHKEKKKKVPECTVASDRPMIFYKNLKDIQFYLFSSTGC